MKILFVMNALDIGGAETFLMRLIKELIGQGHKAFLYLPNSDKNNRSFADFFIKETNVILINNKKPPPKLINYFCYKADLLLKTLGFNVFYTRYLHKRKVRFIQKEIKKYKFDLINSHLHVADVFVYKYLKPILNIPHVITMQGCYDSIFSTGNKKIIEEAISTLKSCEGMTHVADKNLSFFKQTNTEIPKIIKKIYNGLPLPDSSAFKKRMELNLSEKDFIIGQVSRSLESKGMEIAIKAVAYLVEEKGYSNIKLVLVGPENEYYQNLKSTYSDKLFVLFPGETNNSLEWAGLFNIGILPTYFPSESCPSSIIEYLACGKPVISTTIGEIPNMINVNGENAGILIAEKDSNGVPSVEGFVAAIEKFYLDKNHYRQISSLALNAFEKFNISAISKEYLHMYHQVIENFHD